MAVPTVYRWDDVNAPQITNCHDWTQIKDFFDKIFVTGYLDDDNVTMKPALGWGVTVDDGSNTIQLDMLGDPATENLQRIKAYFSSQVAGTRYGAGLEIWEHQGTNQMHSKATSEYSSWVGQSDDDLKICPWIIIGTTRGFWVLSGQNGTVSPPTKPLFTDTVEGFAFAYYGNYINDGVDLGRNIQCAIAGGGITVDMALYTHMALYHQYRYQGTNYGVSTIRDFQNNLVGINDNMNHFEGYSCNLPWLGGNTRALKYPYIDGGLYIKPFQMYHWDSDVYYGRIAGMYYPEHRRPLYVSPSQLIEFTGTGEYVGQNFIGVSTPAKNEFYINISENWDI